MILAGLILLAVGVADLVRQYLGGRARIAGFVLAGIALFGGAVALDAAVWAIVALLIAAAWISVVRSDGSGRAGLWPLGLIGLTCAVSVVAFGARTRTLAIAELWKLPSPAEPIPLDLCVLALGAMVFLLESANIVVRTALRAERVAPAEGGNDGARTRGLKGGRLIGPLERVLVFALMLTGAYTLIAAIFAAKGIVRFPEISRDSDDGNRAEFFLIGSLVSWVIALAAALLVWWASR